MNIQSMFDYCIPTKTLIIAFLMQVGRNYGRTDRRMDDPITRCPRQTIQAGGITKNKNKREVNIWSLSRVIVLHIASVTTSSDMKAHN